MRLDKKAFAETLATARHRLLEARAPAGHWRGELCSSALSTAVAVWALSSAGPRRYRHLVRRGLTWLAENPNADGGWGDTVLSRSNISTTLLAFSAFAAAEEPGKYDSAVSAARAWLARRAGGTAPELLAQAVNDHYQADRTFSVPILAMCALAGRLGPAARAWGLVRALPFELAACPPGWLSRAGLPVVSYALPALIAMGQLRHHFRPPTNPLVRLLRDLTRRRTLEVLARVQPPAGGFLEAAPLTGFVVMALAAVGLGGHSVAVKGVKFLTGGARDDGSWPIDTNLATWVTTLSVNALSSGGSLARHLDRAQRRRLTDWLLGQQWRRVHPYTRAAAGGWAWTDLPGGVPDADDTAGALIALRQLAPADRRVPGAAAAGVNWLLGLRNRDGGVPTFCRGWGKLSFDRSGADLSAHVLSALTVWMSHLPSALGARVRAAVSGLARYLRRAQRSDGAWAPLWFGSESAPGQANLAFGTARVLSALADLADPSPPAQEMIARGAGWLLSAQNADGGWGAAAGMSSSIEETALAVDALGKLRGMETAPAADVTGVEPAIARGVTWLMERTDLGRTTPAAPIGLYFARLWYFQRLYPLIFMVSALERAAGVLGPRARQTVAPGR